MKSSLVSGNIQFLLDTGAGKTVVSSIDALRLGIVYQNLSDRKLMRGVGGEVETRSLPDVLLSFTRKDGEYQYEQLQEVRVLKDSAKLPSLLGIDVLRKYKIAFSGKHCYLDS